MEKERSTKMIAIIALVIGVIGLSVGFAAFTRDLNITFSESSVTPSGTLDMKFLASNDKSDTTTTVIGTTSSDDNGVVTPGNATINGTEISGLSATFTDKNQSVVYEFYVYNNSEYDAYLKKVDFLDVETGKTKVCTPGTGTNETMVENACNDVALTIEIAGEEAFSTDATSFTTPLIQKTTIVPVKVTISYATGDTSADLPNGDFKINFGGIKLSYSSLEG